jgi:HAD superfamily hydrolase (TIGR01544 family)
MENIIISNQEKFKEIKEKFQKEGLNKIHVLADFDKTLTQAFVEEKEIPSTISILRDGNYLTPDYADKAHQLYNKYHPLEIDPEISKEEKKKLMKEWWSSHYDLLIELGLNKKDIEEVIKSNRIKLREGFSELVEFLKENNIPLIIMSSTGLGEESISLKLKQEGLLYDNIYVVSNSLEWDKNGKIISVKEPIITCANKEETIIKSFPDIFRSVKDRKNIILLGDNLEDIGMIEGFDYDNLIKIGFLNKKEERLEYYKENFNVVILKDSSLNFVNDFLKKIK